MAHTITFPHFPLIMCTCGGLPMETTDKKCLLTGMGDTPAADLARITTHPFLPDATLGDAVILTMEAGTADDSFPAWIAGDPSEIRTVPLEMPEASILQSTTLRYIAWGR